MKRSQFRLHWPNTMPERAAPNAGPAAKTRRFRPAHFSNNIDFPGTRNYVDSILKRYEFYKRRGRM